MQRIHLSFEPGLTIRILQFSQVRAFQYENYGDEIGKIYRFRERTPVMEAM